MFPMAAKLLTIIFGLSTQQLPHGVVVETDATHSKEITLKGGSRVVLRPGTRFTYEYIEPMALAVMAILEGEASINLSQGDRAMRLKTSAGGALLMPGNYAVRCEPSCAAMLLTVGAGRAMIRADTAKMGISILSGGKGRVSKAGAAERVADGRGWPVVEPAKGAEGGRGGRGSARSESRGGVRARPFTHAPALRTLAMMVTGDDPNAIRLQCLEDEAVWKPSEERSATGGHCDRKPARILDHLCEDTVECGNELGTELGRTSSVPASGRGDVADRRGMKR